MNEALWLIIRVRWGGISAIKGKLPKRNGEINQRKNTIGFRKSRIQLRMVISYFFAWLPDTIMFLKAMWKRKIKIRGVVQTRSL